LSGKFDLQKNRVQIISIFILLLVIGGVFLIYSKKTSDSVEVAISPNVLDVKNGDYFKVNVLVDPDNKPVTSLQFNLIFNGSLINITNVSQGSFLKQHNAKTIFNTGKLDQDNGTLMKVWGLISTKGGNATASDNFAIIILAAKEKGISKLEFGNVVVGGPGGKSYKVTITNGSVRII
jgi:hypothetical protein